MLRPLQDIFAPERYPDLLVGLAAADDAAVYRLDDDRAIVASTDFFPPVIDDPYDFGAIAAANALSDIYAMGGEPLFAMNLVAFPDDADPAVLREILRGGAEMVASAGAVIAGGHSVSDREPKYGLAVIGTIDPARVMTKGGARVGDQLALTKPLGVGVVTTALKGGTAAPEHVAEAVRWMKRLNKDAARAAREAGATAMTDVTGFGLLGHAHEMAHLGHVGIRLAAGRLPWLPGARAYAEGGAFPGGTHRNFDYYHPWVKFDPALDAVLRNMLWTPETSGGLLIALPEEALPGFLNRHPEGRHVGEIVDGDGHLTLVA